MAVEWKKMAFADDVEPSLGNPDADGKVLSSTIVGVRSWITPPDTNTMRDPATAIPLTHRSGDGEVGTSLLYAREDHRHPSDNTWRPMGTGSTEVFRADHANSAYNHSTSAHAPSNAQANQTISNGNGMNFTGGSGNVTITLGGPGTCHGTTTNGVTTTSHRHAITNTNSRTDSSTSTLLNAAGMNNHRTSNDHDSRYLNLTGGTLSGDLRYSITNSKIEVRAGNTTSLLNFDFPQISGSTQAMVRSFRYTTSTDCRFVVCRGDNTTTSDVILYGGQASYFRYTIDQGSDRALKENIIDVPYGLETLKMLQPRKYTIKDNQSIGMGFIAQELELNIPEVVSGEEGSKSVKYTDLIAVLVRSIQELDSKLVKLEEKIYG